MIASQLNDERKPLTCQSRDDREIVGFDLGWVNVEARLQTQNIHLEGISSCLCNTLSELRPSAHSRAVDTGNDWDRKPFLSLTNQLQIVLDGFATHVGGYIFIRLGIVILSDQMLGMQGDLLLKKGLEDNSTCTCFGIGLRVI